MASFLSIILSNHLSELERLHQTLKEFGKKQGIPGDVLNSVNLALEEIVVNVIEHGYEDEGTHSIVIRCSVQNGQVMVEVDDDGRPFDPLDVPEVDFSYSLEDRPLGGLGVHLMRTVMDDLDYIYENGKNRIKLTKNIQK